MLVPKSNGTACPPASTCGKNNGVQQHAVYHGYSAPAVPEAFQQMTVPMSGHYPLASEFLLRSLYRAN